MASMLRAKQKRQAQLQADQADACVVDLKGHCHLPTIQSKHVVPSNRLLGRCYRRKLHEVVCRKDMFRIWNALGTSIASTMLQGKGVRFDGVLDLTFDIEGQPMYKLEKDQLAGALLYGVSCALAAGGQALFVRGHVQVAAVLLVLAAAAFGVPLRRALKRHASQLEASRGHEPPLPLRRDAAGHWTPTGARPSFWFLLGSFQRTRVDPPPPRACANCAACACATTACTACAALPDGEAGGVRTMTPLDAQTPPPLRPRADSGPMAPDAEDIACRQRQVSRGEEN